MELQLREWIKSRLYRAAYGPLRTVHRKMYKGIKVDHLPPVNSGSCKQADSPMVSPPSGTFRYVKVRISQTVGNAGGVNILRNVY